MQGDNLTSSTSVMFIMVSDQSENSINITLVSHWSMTKTKLIAGELTTHKIVGQYLILDSSNANYTQYSHHTQR